VQETRNDNVRSRPPPCRSCDLAVTQLKRLRWAPSNIALVQSL
jgi:hypothetical protein